MKHLTKILLFTLAALLTIACGSRNNAPRLQPGIEGVFYFKSNKTFTDKTIPVYYFIPKKNTAQTPIQFIMHGVQRNAEDYFQSWLEKAKQYDVAIFAPEFSKADFPLEYYQTGNIADSTNRFNPANETTYNLIDEIYEYIIANSPVKSKTYNIFGHSAGGQFVHRFFLFHQSPYVKTGICANAGWYTVPDTTQQFPYGIKGYDRDTKEVLGDFLQKDLILLLGTADTLRSKDLRMTPETDAQGYTRLARGEYYFNFGKEISAVNSLPFHWTKQYVNNCGHQYRPMGEAAADLLYGKINQ